MELKEANALAVKICYLLLPHCDDKRLNIAGSIRRKVRDVKDIEIITCPKLLVHTDLFQNIERSEVVPGFVTTVNSLGVKEIGNPATGRYVKVLLPEGIKLDLFIPRPEDYYRQYAIRTGSSNYSKLIAATWVKKGWCGTELGLRRQSDCFKDKDGLWHVVKKEGEKPPVWESEQAFFQWLGMKFVPPIERNL